ncbi:hypothetical protein MKZ02_20255 [Pseudobacillus sp. FSL P4-0506]|uniref:hypothetical protein n=1 Tax=Pseudobacillus sp. FSL P4-0506 TaxID=2921576 RepID=UPI0030FC1CEC
MSNYELSKKKLSRLEKVIKFNEKNPDKYCWSDLYDMAVCDDREERVELRDSAKKMLSCKMDLEANGSCWCGKFRRK